jgi:hypothetical protein
MYDNFKLCSKLMKILSKNNQQKQILQAVHRWIGWSLYKYRDWSQGVHLTVKEKLATLKLLKECNRAKFTSLEKDPSVLNVKGMETELQNIQGEQISQ